MASFILSDMVSAYIITLPDAFLAALPIVWIRLLVLLKKPCLSASMMAISDTSGISIPSLNRFIPTTTSYLPSLNSLIILSLSNVFISLCK